MSNYLRIPEINGNYVNTPDAADLDIVGDIDIRIKVRLDDWKSAARQVLIQKYASGDQSFNLVKNDVSTSVLLWRWRNAGGGVDLTQASGDFGLTDELKWVRVTMDVDNGATQHVVTFYKSDDGIAWTTVSNHVRAGITDIRASAASLDVGFNQLASEPPTGDFYEAIVKNGINGTTVADFNADDFNVGDAALATAVGSAGKTWTIRGASSIVIGPPSNVAATADSADQVTVTWDDVSGEDGYIVERSLDGSTGWTNVSGTLPAGTTSYANTGLDPSTEYFYRLVSVFTEGNSEPSTVVSATTLTGEESNRMTGGAIRKPPRVNQSR